MYPVTVFKARRKSERKRKIISLSLRKVQKLWGNMEWH